MTGVQGGGVVGLTAALYAGFLNGTPPRATARSSMEVQAVVAMTPITPAMAANIWSSITPCCWC